MLLESMTPNNEIIVTISNVGCFKGKVVEVTEETFSLANDTVVLASHLPNIKEGRFTFNKKEIYLYRMIS
ncbi:hypothetical protein [Chengkuizengella axinellae]|uniref:DUF2187 domain-containing protein n=1 Tax=Chengkuizengella axinellae TaxID=3064388 RepID=A0ABT9J3J0_9BACL|nr:hypothetical protein [Chengkuizengella sp. 2205SS18-9]MDP5276176.1 hypothetical protein [Chengkuizengella sp. 2205SS18-9]